MKHKAILYMSVLALGCLSPSCVVLEKSQDLWKEVKGANIFHSISPKNGAKAEPAPSPKAATAEATAEAPAEKPLPVLTPPKPTKRAGADTAAVAQKRKLKPLDFLNRSKKNKNPEPATISRKDLDEAIAEDAALQESAIAEKGKDSAAATTVGEVPKPNLPADFTINGEWTIYSVRGDVVRGEERPYINFDLKANRFYGSNGCNYLNGDVYLSGADSMTIDNVIATQRMCHDAPYEYLINLALSDVKSYTATQQGHVTQLTLRGKGGYEVMTLQRHNMDFLNGAWRIVSLNGEPMPAPSGDYVPASITFDIPDLLTHGSSGCNVFNGNLFIDPDKEHSLQLLNLRTTLMECAQESRQTELLLALEAVEQAIAADKTADRVDLLDQAGNVIITLSRIQ